MAKVLQSFLIGVGLETENYDKGAKNVENSLSRMRTLVGFTGTAIAGAFALAGTAAVNAGNRVHGLNLEAEKFKTSASYINAYGRAIAGLGGNASDALQVIGRLEEGIAARTYSADGVMPGEIDLARAGVDINALRTTHTGEDMLRELARQMPGLNKEQQLSVQNTLGFSDAAMKSIRGGVGSLDASIARASELYGEFGRATEAAKEYKRALEEINTRFEGIGETLAEKMLPSFTGVLDSVGGFIDKHKDTIGGAIDAAAENPVSSTLIAGGAGAAIAGSGLSAVGLKGAGSALSKLGLPAMAIGAGAWAWDKRPEDIEALTGYKPSNYIFDKTPLDAAQDAWKYISEKWNGKTPEIADTDYQPIPQSPAVMLGNEVLQRNPYYLESNTRGRQENHSPVPQSPVMIHSQPEQKQIELIVMPNPYPVDDEKKDKPAQPPYSPVAPIYEGGQIDNQEAAKIASPDFTLIKELIEQNSKPQTPQKVNVNNSIDLTVEIEGRALDSRVIEVLERRERDTMDNVISTVDR